MRKVGISVFLTLSVIAIFGGCGASDSIIAETALVPGEETTEGPSPTATKAPTDELAPITPTSTALPLATEEPERGLIPMFVVVPPAPYVLKMGDVELWFEVPEYGDDVRLMGVTKTAWQVTLTVLDDEWGPESPTPGFGIALAEPGASVESVVEAIRESDNGRHSFEVATGVFAGAEATIVTRVSNLAEEDDLTDGAPIELSTGTESTLSHLYTADWTMESHVFERDGRVMIVSYEWSPSRGEREMVLAEAAPIIETIELRSAS